MNLDEDPFAVDDLPAEDRALSWNWQRHASGDWGSHQHGSTHSLWFELGFYRRTRDRVFAWLVRNDERAARIAEAAGWQRTAEVQATPP